LLLLLQAAFGMLVVQGPLQQHKVVCFRAVSRCSMARCRRPATPAAVG
jgi:hypothetical protein